MIKHIRGLFSPVWVFSMSRYAGSLFIIDAHKFFCLCASLRKSRIFGEKSSFHSRCLISFLCLKSGINCLLLVVVKTSRRRGAKMRPSQSSELIFRALMFTPVAETRSRKVRIVIEKPSVVMFPVLRIKPALRSFEC